MLDVYRSIFDIFCTNITQGGNQIDKGLCHCLFQAGFFSNITIDHIQKQNNAIMKGLTKDPIETMDRS